jgi:hypothetical protein
LNMSYLTSNHFFQQAGQDCLRRDPIDSKPMPFFDRRAEPRVILDNEYK